MNQHTPGPWHIGKSPERGAGGTILRELPSICSGDRGRGTDRKLAVVELNMEAFENANLMVASPDLLAACRLALKFCEIGNVQGAGDRGENGEQSLSEILNAAIAKAEGRSS